MRGRGGFIGANVTPASAAINSAASGVWNLREAESLKRAGTWPQVLPQLQFTTGLQLHLDAADSATMFDATSGGSLVAANGGVARWQDKSNNARHATQSTSSKRPVRKTNQQNGLDALQLDGANDCFGISMSLGASNWTFFFAVRPATSSTPSDVRYLFDSETGRLIVAQHASGSYNSVGFFDGTWKEVALATTASQVLTYKLDSSGTNARIYRNGVAVGSAASYTQKSIGGAVGLFAGYEQAGAPADGLVYEVLLYSSALSDADRSAVESYLMNKWGIV